MIDWRLEEYEFEDAVEIATVDNNERRLARVLGLPADLARPVGMLVIAEDALLDVGDRFEALRKILERVR